MHREELNQRGRDADRFRPVVAEFHDKRFDDSIDESFLPLHCLSPAERRKAACQQVLEVLCDDVVGVVRIDRRQRVQPRVSQAVQFLLKC